MQDCEGVLERWTRGDLTLDQASGQVQDPKVEVLVLCCGELEGSSSERSWWGGYDTRQTNTVTSLKYWQGTDIVLQVPLLLPHACDVTGYFHEIHLALQPSRTNRCQTFYSIYIRMQSQISMILYGLTKDTILRRIRSKIFQIDPVIKDTVV